MAISLNTLKPAKGSTHKKKRVGRGPGSGLGKTAGRGEKGQKSRSGYSRKVGFEGGQMPLHRRLPKRGFTNLFRTEFAVVNVGALNALDGEITPERLVKEGLVKAMLSGIKILGDGELTKSIVVKAHRFSKSAAEKIARAGGRAEVLARPEAAR